MKDSQAAKRFFFFGYGYTSEYLMHALREEGGWSFAGTTRDPEKKMQMQDEGVDSYIFNREIPLGDVRGFMQDATHLLISTPPDDSGDPAFGLHGEDIAHMEGLQWIGYLSSTAVYGDRAGGWVDENSELRPTSRRGSRRERAEAQWLSLYHDYNLPMHVFRLAGIYGPGRSALDSVRAGTARRIDKPGQAFSRIHIDDIVAVLRASMERPHPGHVYNVADDEAAPSQKLIAAACEMLGLPVPPLIPYDQADLAPITRSFYADNKRINNERIKTELGVILKHPDFHSGLQACLEAEKLYGIKAAFSDSSEG